MHKAIICFYLVCILAAQDVKTLAKSPLINDGMFVGKSGTIYTTVGGLRGGTQIGKVTPEGEVSVLSGGFSGTIDVYTDDEKTFYATNYDDNTVKRYDSASGKVVTIAEQLDGPASIARGKDGAFYISCFGAPPAYSGHTIVRLDPKSGKQSIFVESPLLFRPQGIVYDNGSFYVMNSPGGRMFRISESGKQIDNFTFIGAPIGNIVKKGSLFFGSSNRGNQLYVIDQHGNYMTLSGNGEPKTVDGSLETAQFFSPLGLALSPDGSLLYVAQSMDGVLRSVNVKNYKMDIDAELRKMEISVKIADKEILISNAKKIGQWQLVGLDGKALSDFQRTELKGNDIRINGINQDCILSFKAGSKRFGLIFKV